MKAFLINVLLKLFNRIIKIYCWCNIENVKITYKLPGSVDIAWPILWGGHIEVGEGTYFMSNCEVFAGKYAHIRIGKNCAIARGVTIRAQTHDKNKPLKKYENHLENDIVIGDNCWIGTNAFIKEGVILGNNVIVGANSVVTKSFPDDVIIGGVPARLISK